MGSWREWWDWHFRRPARDTIHLESFGMNYRLRSKDRNEGFHEEYAEPFESAPSLVFWRDRILIEPDKTNWIYRHRAKDGPYA